MEKFVWDVGKLGVKYLKTSLSKEDGKTWEDALSARSRLTDTLTDYDDRLAELIITENFTLETVPAFKLKESIQKAVLGRKGIFIIFLLYFYLNKLKLF